MRLSLTDAPAADLLGIYLNDHLTGAAAGREIARRCLRNNRGTALGADLEVLLEEIIQDRATLLGVMERLRISRAPLKEVAGVVAERAGRLKLNGQILRYSPLSRLIELEGLCAGVDAKRSMWRSLERIAPSKPELAEVDLKGLVERAERQRSTLDEHRLAAAATAFGS